MSYRCCWLSQTCYDFLAFKIHEKEEDEMNEKNENANCLNEEPLITADQVNRLKTDMILTFMLKSVLSFKVILGIYLFGI